MDIQADEVYPDSKTRFELKEKGNNKPTSHDESFSNDFCLQLTNTQCSNSPWNKTVQQIDEDIPNKDKLEISIKFCKNYMICINKPLIPLKVVLFCWFGAGSFLTPFITVYFKQRGITLSELSLAYAVAPAVQFLGTLSSGIVADKIGRSKPVLVVNLILTILMILCILSVPNDAECIIDCHESNRLSGRCEQCFLNLTDVDSSRENGENSQSNCSRIEETICNCESADGAVVATNFRYKTDERCLNRRAYLNKVTMVFYMFLMVVYSNCYRFLDVTAMYLVEEHKSDFGRERFFSIAGSLIVSPLAGYLVKVTTKEGEEENYTSAFYLFISLIVFILLIVCKLDVRINPPGKKMVRKSLILLKNLDFLSFALVVLVLGTAWSFTTKFLFWYLEDLHVPSILIGLIPAAGALYGLPFLMTSHWWIEKIGTRKIFLLGLLGYVFYGTGYSFLSNPWFSLLLEAFTVVTYHLLWVAVILHSHELAPEGLTATVISLAGSLHYHIGKSCGSLIGGFVMRSYGGKVAFRVVAGICFVSAVLYSLYILMRNKYSQRKLVAQKDDTEEA